jgi:tRNA pseudouridine55 synthase
VVDKPAAWTSHDVVARCRRIFGQRRVGHAGTLDPDATGVLLVGLGKATRLMRYLSGLDKRYRGEVVLGVATSTLDESGEVTGTWDMGAVTLTAARLAADRLTGPILQVPPMVSALKVGGRRLHELARAGVEVEREARPVTVHRLELDLAADQERPIGEGGRGPVFSIDVTCSSGTYVRTLAADLGAALAGGAYLRRLRRLEVGPFGLDEATPLDALGPEHVLSPAAMLRGMTSVTVEGVGIDAVNHGKVLSRQALGITPADPANVGPWAVVDGAGQLLAVYEDHGGDRVKPTVVLAGD